MKKIMEQARSNDWNTHPMPLLHKRIAINRVFSEEDIKKIRNGLIPLVMEDKWFVFWENSTLFFHRSWTGFKNGNKSS